MNLRASRAILLSLFCFFHISPLFAAPTIDEIRAFFGGEIQNPSGTAPLSGEQLQYFWDALTEQEGDKNFKLLLEDVSIWVDPILLKNKVQISDLAKLLLFEQIFENNRISFFVKTNSEQMSQSALYRRKLYGRSLLTVPISSKQPHRAGLLKKIRESREKTGLSPLVLDVGAAHGFMARNMVIAGAQVNALELNPEMEPFLSTTLQASTLFLPDSAVQIEPTTGK